MKEFCTKQKYLLYFGKHLVNSRDGVHLSAKIMKQVLEDHIEHGHIKLV